MKRLAFTLMLFLLAGAIINVSVAWACTFGWEPPPSTGIIRLEDYVASHIWTIQTIGARQEAGGGFSALADRDGLAWITKFEAGLPFRSLGHRTAVEFDEIDDFGYIVPTQFSDRLAIPKSLQREFGQDSVPINPIFPGFAINTFFYGAILWTLYAIPFAIRRRQRIKRGLCVRCAYPLGVGSMCTECGQSKSR